MPPDTQLAVLPRVRLRRMGEADVRALFAIYSSEEGTRYLARPRMGDIAEAREMLARIEAGYADGSSLQLAIERNCDGAFLGVCLLFNIVLGRAARAELGYTLAREHWRQGYLAEALPALIDHAFGAMQLIRLEADIDPRNQASARVLERLGFRREGLLRERWIVRGVPSDSAMYGLLRADWRSR
jgi:RimJ/RimL family protein N-acetyltransferase